MYHEYSEDKLIEQTTEDVLKEFGWQVVMDWQNETFVGCFKRYNPDFPDLTCKCAIEKIVQKEVGKDLAQQNKTRYQLFKNAVEVSFLNVQGKTDKKTQVYRCFFNSGSISFSFNSKTFAIVKNL